MLAKNWQGFRPRRERPNYLHLSVGVGVAAVAFLVYSWLRFAPNESAFVSIAVFDFLFVFLIFPLKGPLLRKVFLLLLGNIVGLAWYLIRSSFGAASVSYLKVDAFKVLYVVLAPIVDFVWIVSVWSLGLSVLASARRKNKLEKESSN